MRLFHVHHAHYRHGFSTLTLAVLIAIAGAGVYGIYHVTNAPKASSEQGEQGASEVEIITIKTEIYRIWNEFSGRLSAVDSVEIRPQVSGTITEIRFKEGSHVKAGDVLLVIDPRIYQAAYDQAKAAVNASQSQSELARTELKRAESLYKQQFLSKSAYEQRTNAAKVSNAAIESSQANLKQAKLNLDYAYVKAPISGVVGRPELTIGNLVQAGPSAPLLTTIVANDEVYAEFDVDEQTYISLTRMKQQQGTMPVELVLAGDKGMVYQGELTSFDNQLNTSSGTIRARAIFKNIDGALVSGMYANVRLGNSLDSQGVLLSERAIGIDQNRRFVYVVNAENKTEYRPVTLGAMVDGKRIITSGLNEGDKVVATGLQKIRPQMPVMPKEQQVAPTPDASTPETKKPE